MKKILILAIAFVGIFALSGCQDATNDVGKTDQPQDTTEVLGSEESLATLSYLSAGFLDFSNVTVSNLYTTRLSNDNNNPTVIEGELDEVNIYMDRLKALMDNGVDSFGSVLEEDSDNELYDYKLTFTVEDEVYVIYYNIDADTGEMTGVIVLGEVEYTFEVLDNIKEYEHNEENKPEDDPDENNDEDTEEDDVDTEESKTKMVLIATNGTDTIKITYKTEVEEDEETIKFYVDQTIDGIESTLSLKITNEEDSTKITIKDGEDEYSFKKNVEEDVVVYMLQYEVDGTKGMVRIKVEEDEEGNVVYKYFIQEAGRNKNVERQKPESRSHMDDDEEDSVST